MYMNPLERGNRNIATYLERVALSNLSKKGYEKAYGYVWVDNVPALGYIESLNGKKKED